jgi:orotate phosphoribosyltransferase
LRNFVKLEICRIIEENFQEVDAIAGVATGAIPQGALVADALYKPFVYVRSKPKDHGLENLIEGELKPGMKVVVIEDLISTGGSSLKAVEAIRNNGCEVIGMVASYTYGFDVAKKAFDDAKVKLITLTNYEAVLEVALKTGYITESQVPVLNEWRKDPSNWQG